MIVRKLRLERGWSQDQLAQLSGLNIRTIQRLETGHKSSLETLKSLAAVFEVSLETLQQINRQDVKIDNLQESVMTTDQHYPDEETIKKYLQDKKGFQLHIVLAFLTLGGIYAINFMVSPWYLWANWAALGWVITLIIHGCLIIDVFWSADWERKQIEKRFGKK